MTFKVGDKVITTKDHDECGNEVFPIGTVGIIKEIRSDTDTPYRVGVKSDYWWYTEDMLEPYEENKEEAKQTETTEVRGERYDPNKADAMIGNVGEQIKVAYGWGYKDGNLDGYQRGFDDGKNCEDKWNYDGAAIYHLRESGWLDKHDKEITEAEYQRGFADGYYQHNVDTSGDAYAIGVEDLREALIEMFTWDSSDLANVFHGKVCIDDILRNYTGQCIIEQVSKYKEVRESKINVGDEIVSDRGSIAIITSMGSQVGDWCCIDKYGCTCELKEETIKAHNWHKTGRHFDDIQGLLEKLQGAENG